MFMERAFSDTEMFSVTGIMKDDRVINHNFLYVLWYIAGGYIKAACFFLLKTLTVTSIYLSEFI